VSYLVGGQAKLVERGGQTGAQFQFRQGLPLEGFPNARFGRLQGLKHSGLAAQALPILILRAGDRNHPLEQELEDAVGVLLAAPGAVAVVQGLLFRLQSLVVRRFFQTQ